MSEWQPIETAPKDGTWMLLWISRTKRAFLSKKETLSAAPYIGTWSDHYKGWFTTPGKPWKVADPSYWMPLPPPPERIER